MLDEALKRKIINENIRVHRLEADQYEKIRAEIFNFLEQKRTTSALKQALVHIDTDSSRKLALDLGCGTGNIAEKLIGFCHTVIGLDLSKAMLSKASSKHQDKIGQEALQLIRGRAATLPFQTDKFDLVSVYSLLHHLPEFSLIEEIARVLKPGGILYIDHEPLCQENRVLKLYQKSCDLLNKLYFHGNGVEKADLDHTWSDYHIYSNAGVPIQKVKELCRKNGIKKVFSKKYLNHRSYIPNPLYPVFRKVVDSEWLFIGKKEP